MNCIVSHLGAYPMDFDIHRSSIHLYLYLYLLVSVSCEPNYGLKQNMQMQFPTVTPPLQGKQNECGN